uniref:Uncharacterized protein n=1 Tax=Rhizophora mucronata TaxID=61149 RepID=A0A2P2JP17_RHIMU
MGRSITQTTKPVNRKKAALDSQRSAVKGFRKTHIDFDFSSGARATIPTPKSVYGKVKSTNNDLLAEIVISPTAPSYFFFAQFNCPVKFKE